MVVAVGYGWLLFAVTVESLIKWGGYGWLRLKLSSL